jgi:DNA sulfur modification protein DndD
LQREIEDIETSEKEYHDKLNDLTSRIEDNLCFPHLQASVLDDTRNAIRVRQQEQSQGADLSPETITKLVQAALEYLNRDGLLVKAPDPGQVIEFIKSTLQPQKSDNPYAFLDADELKELEKLINQSFVNEFPSLLNRQVGLNQNLVRLDDLRREYEDTRKRIIKTDYALIKEFEEKDTLRRRLEDERTKLLNEIDKIKDRLAQYDIDVVNEPDARHDTLQKLPTFFERVANRLLLNKKRQIEETMLADLNINLNAYHNVIDRVELSDHLRDLTFKIFHKAGNEIHLNQLNTASKQVVIQVLLKALHELGDYDPPVMIDTVMGALDRESRATILESYFPKLAHQTILLSSDSEIDPETDYYKIKPFISKSYTLQRDRELQQSTVVKGYFN